MTDTKVTAGELDEKCARDSTKYDYLEVGHALTDDILDQLLICAHRHEKIFNEDEFFVGLIVASDPLIKHVRRHKYFALLYLPQPRPQQAIFLYNKKLGKIKRLWSLPDAKVMATISEMGYVSPEWTQTKGWCDAFFRGDFFNFIRGQHSISHLSESEYLETNREKLIKAGCKESETLLPEPFDFNKVSIEKREKVRMEEQRKKEVQELPSRLNSMYTDFSQVCSQDNLDYLEFHHPEIAKALSYMPDSLDKWATVYKTVKKFIPNTETKKEERRMEKNSLKPKSMSAGLSNTGDQAPVYLDDAKRAANWDRMQKTMRGG